MRISSIFDEKIGKLMKICCTQCQSQTVRKNGSIHSGKQKYKCLACHKQFVEEPQNKIISDDIKERIRRSLLERVSLEGICRIFDVSMPWLLGFMEKTFQSLPEDLNATIIAENDEFEVAVLEGDEMWSFVGSKSNDQWLWLVMHSSTRQILAFHVGKRNKAAGEALMAKLPEELKKKPTFTQISSRFIMKLSHGRNIVLSAKNLGRQVTLKDLIARSDRDVQD
ncbi:transposase (plasmid) [Candidatus Protochlamydia naegleriophila]|uniref:Transposase n=1 Tax=Candidatus Protochlamydia naegleriophila TaxID=389348 RepID=A0A0U5CSV7_9BACT|nr:transposase [Candidatus Protochlamydia naegleriophila]